LVTQTGNALERIVAQVVEINNIISDIASSAQQQAAGLQQVNTAVNEMDKVTQQNAAMVEETTAACHSLVAETEELTQLVGHYQTGQVAEDPLRAQLKKAAPHAFREAPKKVSSTEASASSRAKPEPVRRSAQKAVANASGSRIAAAGGDESWQDF
jgi:methyl-accepting chemotaxis protein